MNDLTDFSILAMTLAPWRSKIVFVGGWAFRLYQYEARADKRDFAAIITEDADVAYAAKEPLEGDIKKALEGAGFKEEPNLAGGFRPPVMRYTLADRSNGFYAEFLTPLTGSGMVRNRLTKVLEVDATEANAGVVAQKLRDLELLLHEPWLVTIPAAESGVNEAVVDLRVPNPVSFIVQKLLIRKSRLAPKLAQDVVYIHDALSIFSGAMGSDLVPAWKSLEATLTESQRKSVLVGVETLFTAVNDTIDAAVKIPQDRSIRPDELLKVCQDGFAELFGAAD